MASPGRAWRRRRGRCRAGTGRTLAPKHLERFRSFIPPQSGYPGAHSAPKCSSSMALARPPDSSVAGPPGGGVRRPGDTDHAAGGPEHHLRLGRSDVVRLRLPGFLLPEGRVLAVPAVFSTPIATGQVEEAPFVRYASGGAMLDTLRLQPAAGTHVKLETGSGLRPSVRQPFLSRPEVAPDLRCQFLVLAEEVPVGLRLTRVMLADGERTVHEIPVDRVRLSRRDVDAELTRLSLNAERWGMQPARLESVYRRTVTIPDHAPVFTHALAASGGYVWLRGFPPRRRSPGRATPSGGIRRSRSLFPGGTSSRMQPTTGSGSSGEASSTCPGW
jgi:hypothetical protein